MKHIDKPYYVGLASAAACHGAGASDPQSCQVMIAERRDPFVRGGLHIEYVKRVHLDAGFSQMHGADETAFAVSTPEVTALELVGYHGRVGDWRSISRWLSGLHPHLDPLRLVEAARQMPMSWCQRLGYLLDRAGASHKADELRTFVRLNTNTLMPLVPGRTSPSMARNSDWRLVLNAPGDAP